MEFEDFTGLYEVSKTLRFELKPSKDTFEKLEKIKEKYLKNGDIGKLLNQFIKIEKDFLDVFVYKYDKENKNLEFKKNRKIRYSWLRSYTKNNFYDWIEEKNKKEKDYLLTEVDYLERVFLERVNEWQKLIKKIENLTETKEVK